MALHDFFYILLFILIFLWLMLKYILSYLNCLVIIKKKCNEGLLFVVHIVRDSCILFYRLIGGSDNKLIYRHYATLYFVFCVDSSESELGILDLIQVFVETLDKCFENVCELDLIFHVDKVHNILAEMVMGGMVLETNMNEIVTQIDAQTKLEKSENFIFQSPRQDR
uniref:Cysteine dioxygenase type 1 n=1 Tax=Leptobrachium leishanense TaxID=445787 RepID=A0A8C5PNM7_9ANUR